MMQKRTGETKHRQGVIDIPHMEHPQPVRISILDYDKHEATFRSNVDVKECFPYRKKPSTTWINVDGLHRQDIIENLGRRFGLHHLIIEDILHPRQRPKLEQYGNCIFIVLKMLTYADGVRAEQVSFVLGENFVISFQEGTDGDVFDAIRAQIRADATRIRTMGADYLVYALIDAIVDNYFVVLDQLGEHLEELEEILIKDPSKELLQRINDLKQQMLVVRKAVVPLRDVLLLMSRRDFPHMTPELQPYLRDVYDHLVRIIDMIETDREMVAGMLEIYLSSVSYKLNEVMKVLTIISTIFIPLTFIAGIYGMNFHYLPEITWRYGYLFFWIVIILVAVTMLVFFKRRRWF